MIPALAGAVCVAMAGCNWLKTDGSRWVDPSRVINAPEEASPVMAIRSSIGPADQADELIPNATWPEERDYTYSDQDYILGAGDVVDVSIMDLVFDGQETVHRRQVSESGYISLPQLPARLRAEGLTQEQLKEAISSAYSPDVLRDPIIAVTILQKRQNTVSIDGAVGRPGQFNIIRPDMRLWEALALSGGIVQPNIRYVYVIRQSPPVLAGGKARRKGPAEGAGLLPGLPTIPDEEPKAKPAVKPKKPALKPAAVSPKPKKPTSKVIKPAPKPAPSVKTTQPPAKKKAAPPPKAKKR